MSGVKLEILDWDSGHLPNQFLGGAVESLVEISISKSAYVTKRQKIHYKRVAKSVK